MIGLHLGICDLCIRAVFVAAILKAGGIKIFKRRGSRQKRFNVNWLDGVNNAKNHRVSIWTNRTTPIA